MIMRNNSFVVIQYKMELFNEYKMYTFCCTKMYSENSCLNSYHNDRKGKLQMF